MLIAVVEEPSRAGKVGCLNEMLFGMSLKMSLKMFLEMFMEMFM